MRLTPRSGRCAQRPRRTATAPGIPHPAPGRALRLASPDASSTPVDTASGVPHRTAEG